MSLDTVQLGLTWSETVQSVIHDLSIFYIDNNYTAELQIGFESMVDVQRPGSNSLNPVPE